MASIENQTTLLTQYADNTAGDISADDGRSVILSCVHNLPTSQTGENTIIAQSATVIPLTIEAHASQSADLLNIKDSSGSVVASVNSSGQWTGDGSLLTGGVKTVTATDSGSGLDFSSAPANTNVYYGYVNSGITSGTLQLPTPSVGTSATLIIDNSANQSGTSYTLTDTNTNIIVINENFYFLFCPINYNVSPDDIWLYNYLNPLLTDSGKISSDGLGNLVIEGAGGTGVGLFVSTGSTSLDGGAITTDGSGNLVIAGAGGTGIGLYVETGTTSLDANLITTDGSGNLTVSGGANFASNTITANDGALTASVLVASTTFSCESAGITTDGKGTMSFADGTQLDLNYTTAITTSTIQNVDGTRDAINALCTALGIETN